MPCILLVRIHPKRAQWKFSFLKRNFFHTKFLIRLLVLNICFFMRRFLENYFQAVFVGVGCFEDIISVLDYKVS